jgi:arylsulfatase A-like enzyme
LTPYFDALAREATVFEHCVAPMGTTSPSHATLFTGLYPTDHRVTSNRDRLPDSIPTLAAAFQKNGYATGAFVSLRSLIDTGGLERGFDRVDLYETRRADNNRRMVLVREGAATLASARSWLETVQREGRQPVFAWLHFYEPHSPYVPSPHSRERLKDYRGMYADGMDTISFGLGLWMASDEQTRALGALYDGRVQVADQLVGDLMDELRELQLLDDAIVVIAADHGQALGEHGLPGHGRGIWESVLEVPCLIWDARDRKARRIGDRVGLIDIAPTLLDLAGLPPLANVAGRSLVPALRDQPLPPAPYFASTQFVPSKEGGAPGEVDPRKPYEVAVYEGDLKLMHGDAGTALFDLSQDPKELSPLPESSRPDAYERLSVLALEHHRELKGTATDAAPAHEIPDEVAEGLRALGYTD